LLWISPLTVRRHLENVFGKLGVRTRTAAVTRFLGLIDDNDDRSAPGSSYST
jgi:DNA-binding CsgD family transcriptional regulator